MNAETLPLWIGFNLFVLALLALDLGVFHRKAHAVSLREAALWSGVWMGLALVFNLGIYFWRGSETALEFFAGYMIEKSLSVDNIFVFVLIFTAFAVPAASQHRVLFWGILGALVMRGAIILLGSVLLEQFHWIIYLFGAFLIFNGLWMARPQEHEPQPEKNPLVGLARRWIPLTDRYEDHRFIVRHGGKLIATPLVLVLIVVESTDLLFAVDSIPAVFAVTRDPLIVYTSNVFAILGLRALYFLFAGLVPKFHYLKLGLAAILVCVGIKMVAADIYPIPIAVSLLVIATILLIAVVASLARARGFSSRETLKAS